MSGVSRVHPGVTEAPALRSLHPRQSQCQQEPGRHGGKRCGQERRQTRPPPPGWSWQGLPRGALPPQKEPQRRRREAQALLGGGRGGPRDALSGVPSGGGTPSIWSSLMAWVTGITLCLRQQPRVHGPRLTSHVGVPVSFPSCIKNGSCSCLRRTHWGPWLSHPPACVTVPGSLGAQSVLNKQGMKERMSERTDERTHG